ICTKKYIAIPLKYRWGFAGVYSRTGWGWDDIAKHVNTYYGFSYGCTLLCSPRVAGKVRLCRAFPNAASASIYRVACTRYMEA
ncbi:MAG: hypothetical protein WAX89_00580, partial [Alphaproteobacteria bacterium]